MKTQINYEWTLEILQDGEIIDNDFSDTLSFNKNDLQGNDLGLVRNEGNEAQGLENRYWAYVKDGKLPVYFADSMGEITGIKVAAKFHNELNHFLCNK